MAGAPKKGLTSVQPYDDEEEDEDDFDFDEGLLESPKRSKRKLKRGCCSRCILELEHRLVVGYKDKGLQDVIEKFQIRDQGVSVKELSSFEESHSIRHVKDADKDHAKRTSCCPFPIFPNSKTRAIVDMAMILCVVIDAFYIPFSVAFIDSNTVKWEQQLLAESIIDGIFLLDWASYFVTAYVAGDAAIEVRITHIFWNYLRSWKFVLNLLCAFPFQLLAYFNQTSFDGYKLFSLIRIVRLYDLFPVVFRWFSGSALFDGCMNKMRISRKGFIFEILKLLVALLILLHFSGCWWIIVNKQFDEEAHNAWLESHHIQQGDGYFDSETLNVYLVSIETVVGCLIGETSDFSSNAQKLNALVFQIGGIFVIAYIFGKVAIILHDLHTRTYTYNEKIARVTQTMEYLRLPKATQYRVRKYYEYLWSQFGGFDQNMANKLASEVSDPLGLEMSLYLHEKQMRAISIFKDIGREVIKSLVQQMQVEIYMPGDYIARKGERVNKLFMVTRGRCELIENTADGTHVEIIRRLKEGDHFGEISLLDGRKCEATVRAVTYCNFNTISKYAFQVIRKAHPSYGATLDKIMIQQIQIRGAAKTVG